MVNASSEPSYPASEVALSWCCWQWFEVVLGVFSGPQVMAIGTVREVIKEKWRRLVHLCRRLAEAHGERSVAVLVKLSA